MKYLLFWTQCFVKCHFNEWKVLGSIKMDIFKIEPGSSISANITNIIDDTCDQLPEVNFDAGSEFNLRFFNAPDDSNTQGGFSDAGSVDESSVRSPSPSVNNDSNNCAGNLIEQFVGGGIGQFQIIQPPALVNNIKSGECVYGF